MHYKGWVVDGHALLEEVANQHYAAQSDHQGVTLLQCIHHPSPNIRHPSSIIRHPSSIIHPFFHHPSSVIQDTSSIIHHPSYIKHHTSSIIHRPSSISHRPSYIIHHPSASIQHPAYIIHHPSSIIPRTSSIIHHPSSTIQHTPSIIHHPSSIVHRTSDIVHHTSSLLHYITTSCMLSEGAKVTTRKVTSGRYSILQKQRRNVRVSKNRCHNWSVVARWSYKCWSLEHSDDGVMLHDALVKLKCLMY